MSNNFFDFFGIKVIILINHRNKLFPELKPKNLSTFRKNWLHHIGERDGFDLCLFDLDVDILVNLEGFSYNLVEVFNKNCYI